MNNWIPKNKIIKFAGAFALLSIALYFVALFIVFGEAKKLENFYQNTETESSKAERFLAIKSATEANKEQIQTLEDFFVKKDDEVKFIEQIEAIAGTSGIKFEIASIDVKADQPNSFEENVSVKVSVEGGWNEIISFINKLEKMPFGVLIGNINLDAKGSGNWAGSVESVVFREK
jgi:Tfp pilus assembly protein PilO